MGNGKRETGSDIHGVSSNPRQVKSSLVSSAFHSLRRQAKPNWKERKKVRERGQDVVQAVVVATLVCCFVAVLLRLTIPVSSFFLYFLFLFLVPSSSPVIMTVWCSFSPVSLEGAVRRLAQRNKNDGWKSQSVRILKI